MKPASRFCGSVVMLCGLLAFATGCGSTDSGPPRATVAGKITLDGMPVEGGEIRFVPAKGAETVSRIGPDGSYSIDVLTDGPVVGQNKVFIEWFRDSGKKDSEGNMIPIAAIPAKYNSATTLSAEMKSGKNTHNFALDSK